MNALDTVKSFEAQANAIIMLADAVAPLVPGTIGADVRAALGIAQAAVPVAEDVATAIDQATGQATGTEAQADPITGLIAELQNFLGGVLAKHQGAKAAKVAANKAAKKAAAQAPAPAA